MKLTTKQRRLTKEVDDLLNLLCLSSDVSGIEKEFRTTHLELAKRDLVISGVLGKYLLADEYLNDMICREFFPSKSYPQLWRTKKFKAFNYYVLERLYLVQKAEFVRVRTHMPKEVYKNLLALNELRNALAHSFFPENRRVKPSWKGDDIFSKDGFEHFFDDTVRVLDFFVTRVRQANRRNNRKTD